MKRFLLFLSVVFLGLGIAVAQEPQTVTVTYADGTTATFWADRTERDNCRSLALVAQSALADTTATWTEAEKALLNTIAGN